MNTYEEEIYEFVTTPENFKSAVEISNLLPEIKIRLAKDFWKHVKSILENNYKDSGCQVKIEESDLIITKDKWKSYDVRLRKLKGGNLHYGIYVLVTTREENEKQSNLSECRESIDDKEMTIDLKNEKWVCYRYINEDIGKTEILMKILPEIRGAFANEKASLIFDFVKNHEGKLDKFNDI